VVICHSTPGSYCQLFTYNQRCAESFRACFQGWGQATGGHDLVVTERSAGMKATAPPEEA